jgi:hypothetical protein
MNTGTILLLVGGALSAAAAVLHLVVIWYGAPAYRYFGAGERLATMAANRSPWPGILTFGIAATLAGFAAYAFAGAGMLKLPWTRAVILAIGALYAARGLALAPVALIQRGASRFDVVSSLAALVMGIAYLAGALLSGPTGAGLQ